jgi:hypothetical protein
MFVGRQYKRVSQQGDSDSDTTDNETAFFTSENGTRKWRMGMSPGNLNQDPELDPPYVHPTLPVELKKEKLSRGRFSRRELISGACLLLVILAMVVAFSVTIILGQKFIVEVPPTNTDNHDNIPLVTTHATNVPWPAVTPLVNFEGNKGSTPTRQDSTCTWCTGTAAGTMATSSSPRVKSVSSFLSPTPIPTIKVSSTVHSTTTPTAPAAATERTHIASDTEERRLHPFPQAYRGRHIYAD